MPVASLNAIVADKEGGGVKSKGSIKDKRKSITGALYFQYWFVGYQWVGGNDVKHMFGRESITHRATPK